MHRFYPKLTGHLEYDDDLEMIPKDSTVVGQRLPAAIPGKGRAARYVSGKPPATSRAGTAAAAMKNNKVLDMEKAQTEEERVKAMLNLNQAQWQQKQEEMSHETRVPITGVKNLKRSNVPEGEPPHGYVCYRCGKKGHWIQACPTNDDANYDNKNRIKRTTGIPRSMLKKIDPEDVEKLDDEQRQKLMVNAEGEYVFALADEKEWRKHLEKVKATEKAQKEVNMGNKELQERGLECSIDKRMFVDPMKTPCCGKTYCHDCIENALIESDLTCPGCQTENVSLERLEPDEDMKARIKAYEAEKAEMKGRSRSPTAAPTPAAEGGDGSPGSREGSKSPGGGPRKRKADETADGASSTLAAPEMKRQKSLEAPSEKEHADIQASNPNTVPDMMPPDMATMMQNMSSMNYPNMPMNMAAMPFMGMMPGMMPNFMAPNFNAMNGMNFNNVPLMNMNGGTMYPNQNQYQNPNQSFPRKPYHQKHHHPHQHQQPTPPPQSSSPMTGMPGVPTGPKAQQQQGQPQNPGPKFSNQQRHVGNEEDNAYMRQPVNPHRYQNRRRGAMRQADYRELGS